MEDVAGKKIFEPPRSHGDNVICYLRKLIRLIHHFSRVIKQQIFTTTKKLIPVIDFFFF